MAARRTNGLISQWCVWVRDCNFVTYQPGVTTADWYPTPLGSASTYVTSVLDTVTGQTARAVYMPYGSAFEENVNFGAYNPQVTYAYTLTFDAQAIKVDPDAHSAELYVGFSPDTCSYDWQVVSAEPPTNGWHHYAIVGPSPSYSQSQTAPPPVVCFMNNNGQHAAVEVANPSLTISQGGQVFTPPLCTQQASGTLPWRPHHSVRFSDKLSASVDLCDGHVDISAADVNIPARGQALTLNHVWDSSIAQTGVTTTAGAGWLSDLTPSMGGVLTGTVVYTTSTGETWPFTYTGALTATEPYTSYLTPAGLPWQLTTSSAGYTLTNILNSEVMTFTAQGAYAGDQDAYGNTNVLSYTNGLPTMEANSGGRTLALTYTNGLLSEAASPLWQASGGTQGQHVTYGYNGTQLTTQTLGAGTTDALTATFGYSGTQLVSVTTPPGHAHLEYHLRPLRPCQQHR